MCKFYDLSCYTTWNKPNLSNKEQLKYLPTARYLIYLLIDVSIMFIQVFKILNLAAKQDGVTYQTEVRWLCPQSRQSWGPPSRLCRWAQPSFPDTGRWPSVAWLSSHPPQAVEVYPMASLKTREFRFVHLLFWVGIWTYISNTILMTN